MRSKGILRFAAIALVALLPACASRTPPAATVPLAPKYTEFLFPAVPAEYQKTVAADRLERGWRLLQSDDLRGADREFGAALQRSPDFYPAQTGAAYVALARGDQLKAVATFDGVLSRSPRYVPALVGRGQSLLALKREPEALAAFEVAVAVDPTLIDLKSRIDVLRFRGTQAVIEEARSAAASDRIDAAVAAYMRAIAMSPESGFLHREIGIVERRRSNTREALDHFRRGVELDPSDVVSLVQMAELLEQGGDFLAAEAAYRKAADVEPSSELSARVAAIAAKGRDARLPAEVRAIAAASQISRGELAALIGIRLESVLRDAPNRQVVMTDTRGHWAAQWITRVAAAGVIDPFENHTFQPRSALRRVELARAVNQLVRLIAAKHPELRNRLTEKPRIADMTPGHLDYPAVSVSVATGVIPLGAEQRFGLNATVSGAEALDAIGRLQALAGVDR
jgi:tetratricopeptide (TPR) repeat protein